jgi:dimethylglycine dehydrogenase
LKNGVWTHDFRPDFSAAESCIDAFISWDRGFVGKQAAEQERQNGISKRLATMTVDTNQIDVCNDEAILENDECVGYVTSGGYAHPLKQSMAMSYVPAEMAPPDTELEIEIFGDSYASKIIDQPLYDPQELKMGG